MYDKTYPHMGSCSSSPNHLQKRLSTIILDDEKTTATQQQPQMRGSLPSQTPPAMANPFYFCIFFCMGEGAVSSVSCRPGALIIPYPCVTTIVEMSLICTNVILVVDICFERMNRNYLTRNRMGRKGRNTIIKWR